MVLLTTIPRLPLLWLSLSLSRFYVDRRGAIGNARACIPAGAHPMETFTIKATVPGELITDLQNAGKVLDPLSSNNHKDPSQVAWWNGDVYTYTKTFAHTAAAAAGRTLLVFDGIKLGAVVTLNGTMTSTSI